MAVVNAPEYGGYDYEFTETTATKFICIICTKVLRNPHLTLCCGQHFCQSCLENWFKKHGKKLCPHCREKKGFNHVLNKEKRREVGELKIHCTHHQEGCQWVGELDSLQTHLNSDRGCDYMEVNCTNKCGEKMKRKEQMYHLANQCVLRKCQCLHCNHIDTYQAIIRHCSICPNVPLLCPNKCGEGGIKRKNMSAHRETCPLEVVSCTNKCGLKMKRKEQMYHLANQCVLRKRQCLHCNHKDTYQAISQHYSICPNYPLLCPNKCGESNITRKNMSAHRETCPLESVECPFAAAGCRSKVVRRDYDAHVADNQQQHTLMLMQAFKASRLEVQLTKAALQAQIKAQEKLASQLRAHEKELRAHEKELRATKNELTKLEAMREVVATDVEIMSQRGMQFNVELESIKTQMRLGLKNVRLTRGGEPLTIRMSRVSHYEQTDEAWNSPPFYYDTGYKMCLSIRLGAASMWDAQCGMPLGGSQKMVGWTCASVSLLLLKGEFDDQLTWPIRNYADISIQLMSDSRMGQIIVRHNLQTRHNRHSHQQRQGKSPSPGQASFCVCSRCTGLRLQRILDDEDSQLVGEQRISYDNQTYKRHDSIVLKVSVDTHSCLGA